MDYSTTNYRIVVGEDKDNENPIYQIVNSETGVVEYDDFILPRTIEAILNLQEKFDEAVAIFERSKLEPLSLVRESDEQGSIH